jgi:uncharacterized protein (TIGR00255 family)
MSMRRSMTAYGRSALQTKRARWTLEIASVNRKGLDIHLHLPHSLLFLDPVIRKWVSKITERGNLTIRVSCEIREVSSMIQQLSYEKKRWEEIAKSLKISPEQITLSFLLDQISPQEAALNPELFEKEIEVVWHQASKAWLTMKEQEGRALVKDIHSRLKIIGQELKKIEKELPQLAKEHLKQFSKRMDDLKLTINEEQLAKEALLQAGRDDVTEEMIRMKSHMDQMNQYLKSAEKSVGRTLDFLAQEMGREIGTLMAKAGSSKIAQKAVKIKTEIEKIREQVQNIE